MGFSPGCVPAYVTFYRTSPQAIRKESPILGNSLQRILNKGGNNIYLGVIGRNCQELQNPVANDPRWVNPFPSLPPPFPSIHHTNQRFQPWETGNLPTRVHGPRIVGGNVCRFP